MIFHLLIHSFLSYFCSNFFFFFVIRRNIKISPTIQRRRMKTQTKKKWMKIRQLYAFIVDIQRFTHKKSNSDSSSNWFFMFRFFFVSLLFFISATFAVIMFLHLLVLVQYVSGSDTKAHIFVFTPSFLFFFLFFSFSLCIFLFIWRSFFTLVHPADVHFVSLTNLSAIKKRLFPLETRKKRTNRMKDKKPNEKKNQSTSWIKYESGLKRSSRISCKSQN